MKDKEKKCDICGASLSDHFVNINGILLCLVCFFINYRVTIWGVA